MLKNLSKQIICKRKIQKIPVTPVTILALGLAFLVGMHIIVSPVYAASDANSQYSLKGAKYQLYTNKKCTVKARDIDGNNAMLSTNAKGKTGKLKMKPGTYYAKEIVASKGYKLDTKAYTVKITASNTASNPASFTSPEPPLYGVPDFRVFKTSDDEGYAGYERFLGAEFTVKYYDVSTKADIKGASPMDQWTFEASKKDPPGWDEDPDHCYAGFDWQTDTPVSYAHNGSGKFYIAGGKRVLPLGWFTIEETKAPEGFKISDKKCYGRIYKDKNTGKVITRIDGEDLKSGQTKELLFRDVPYAAKIKKTDSVTGKAVDGAGLQLLQEDKVIDEWETTSESHDIVGLPAGTYTLRETKAPYGYDIADDVTFTAKEGEDTIVGMKNTPVTVATSASDADTGKRTGRISKKETIIDTVHLTGLNSGRRYRLEGILMDKESGRPMKDSGGGDITAEAEFEAGAEVMDVKMSFTVDSSSFTPGSESVVFETLKRVSPVYGDKVPVEIQKHQDINDKDQTIVYPGISTTATDRTSGTQNILAGTDAVITDKVRYTGLIAGETYVLEGEIYDSTAERLTGIKSTEYFSAKAAGGTAEMEFSFDAADLTGHTLVVFETLRSGDVTLVEHKDKSDAAQTLYVPGIRTAASLCKGNREIKDVIDYENLLPKQKYVFRGWLVDTATGDKVPDSDGSADLTTGTGTSGQIVMSLDAGQYDGMTGHSMTAFEELYLVKEVNGEEKEILVASHKDTGDSDQTVPVYQDLKVKKKVTGNLGDLSKVFGYRLEFSDLVPETAYTIDGDDTKTFMSDGSGNATVPLKLMDGQTAVIRQLPKGAKYRITEAASDHAAGFRIFSEDKANKGAKIIKASGSNEKEAEKALATAMETVDLSDGTVVVLWENNRELAALTGVAGLDYAVYAASLALILLAAFAIIRRHRKYADDDGRSA